MASNLPIALINGMENFVAKLLAVELVNKDIKVVGIGEIGEKVEQRENFEMKESLEEVEEKLSYVFDFRGEEGVWEKAEKDEARLAVVRVNNLDGEEVWGKMWGRGGNWRLIEIMDAFGPGMERGSWLSDLFEAAVRNQELELPSLNLELRIVSGEDAVETVLRGTLMSGTDKERFLVAGEEIKGAQVKDWLIHGAKMTKKGVKENMGLYKEWNSEAVEENWNKLRWKPEGDLKESINKTLQYFFTVVDEESRNKKRETGNMKREKKRMWEVEVEEDRSQISDLRSQEDKKGSQDSSKKKLWDIEVEEEVEEGGSKTEEAEKQEILRQAQDKPMWVKTKVEEEGRGSTDAIAMADKSSIVDRSKTEEREKQEEKEHEEELEEIEEEELSEKKYESEFKIKRSGFGIEEDRSQISDIRYQENQNQKQTEHKGWSSMEASGRSRLEAKNKKKKINFKLKLNLSFLKSVNLSWMLIGGLVALLIIMAMPGALIWKTINIAKAAENYPKLIEEKKYDEAGKIVVKNLEAVKKIEGIIDDMGIKSIGYVRNYYNGMKVLEGVLELEGQGLEMVKMGEKMNEAVFGDKDIKWSDEVKNINNSLGNFEAKAGVLQARLGGDWSWLPSRWHNLPNKGTAQLNEVRNLVSMVRKSMDFVPELVGADGKKKEYLVLLQNEMEIRPGGGFVGSIAYLSFDDGKLINFDIEDVYEVDGQLKGHVEPPAEIKDYLGEASWYLRDANWQPSFVASAKDIQWFLEKETGRKVDGVIGMDLAVAKEILKNTGEVYVPDFKEKVNKDNLYEQAEFYSENKFFPGSQQKENFLGLLGRQLFEEIKGMKPVQRLGMLESLIDLLERNELQLAINDKSAAKKIAELGWDGGMYEGRCNGANCYTDYFYAMEANMGVNKANYFLYRNIDMVVDISGRAVTRVVKINYENTAKSSNWPGGDYKNFLRLYLPSDANLAEVAVYNSEDPSTKKVFSMDELKIKKSGSKKEIGLLITVPITKKRTVEIRYTNEVDLVDKDKFSYLSYIQRQPGYGNTGLVSLVSFPEGWQPLQVQPAANLVGGKLLFNQKFDRDVKMGVEISK